MLSTDYDKSGLKDEHMICLLACLHSIEQDQTVSSWMEEVRKAGSRPFLLSKVHTFRRALELLSKDVSADDFEELFNEIQVTFLQNNEFRPITQACLIPDKWQDILASLKDQKYDLGGVEPRQATMTDIAIIIGFALARQKIYIDLCFISSRMLHIGAAIAHGIPQIGCPTPNSIPLYQAPPMQRHVAKWNFFVRKLEPSSK
ncbi:hypothetical protein LZL87_013746 [Fusarium oxysporum]|nr:hypothetical protein LZL87_013746 [Fusarium oxysporum]